MTIAIIDYGAGNLHSAQKAFERVLIDSGSSDRVIVTSDADVVAKADRIVLPGVGAFADCKRGLVAVPGMIDALTEAVIHGGRPFIGICVGMQLLATRGLEKETTDGLGWIDGDVALITPDDPSLVIPHMGWNTLDLVRPHAVLDGLVTGDDGLHAYFVHSYHMHVRTPGQLIATAGYGGPVTAIVGRDNIVGVQFHPEKSQRLGLGLIGNFLKWAP